MTRIGSCSDRACDMPLWSDCGATVHTSSANWLAISWETLIPSASMPSSLTRRMRERRLVGAVISLFNMWTGGAAVSLLIPGFENQAPAGHGLRAAERPPIGSVIDPQIVKRNGVVTPTHHPVQR